MKDIQLKAIILDADGMIVESERFSERLAEKLHIPLDRITPFFKTRFPLCVIGQADLKDELKKVIPIWGWEGSSDELLEFWFQEKHNRIDQRFKILIEKIREADIKVYLATNNEKYRTGDLINRRGLGQWFDGVFSSAFVGAKKPESEFFQSIFDAIDQKIEDTMFWDDDEGNVAGAEAFGLFAERYTGFDDFERKMKLLLG